MYDSVACVSSVRSSDMKARASPKTGELMADDSKMKSIIVNKFTEDSAKDFREKVLSRSDIDHNMPIVIYIDSYGGYLDSLNSMLETIEQVPNPIVTVCIGKAMSAGAALLAAGNHRFCGRKSRVMVHQGSSGAGGPIESLQNDVDESKRINNQMMTMIAKRCGKTLKQFKDEMKSKLHRNDDEARDMYLDAKDALDMGIVDYIGLPLIKPLIMYTIEPAPEKKYEDSEVTSIEAVLAEAGIKESNDGKKKKVRRKTTKKKAKKTSRRNK